MAGEHRNTIGMVDLVNKQTWLPVVITFLAIVVTIVVYHYRDVQPAAGPAALGVLLLTLAALLLFFVNLTFDCNILLSVIIIWIVYGIVWNAAGVQYGDFVSAISSTLIGIGMLLTYSSKSRLKNAPQLGTFVVIAAVAAMPNRYNMAALMSTAFIVVHVAFAIGIFMLSQFMELILNNSSKAVLMSNSEHLVKAVRIGWPLFVHHYALVLIVLQIVPHLIEMNQFIKQLTGLPTTVERKDSSTQQDDGSTAASANNKWFISTEDLKNTKVIGAFLASPVSGSPKVQRAKPTPSLSLDSITVVKDTTDQSSTEKDSSSAQKTYFSMEMLHSVAR